eukprot:TRINITY_DN107586_c0_g1_i1.p1 TRINITY_DN107586_c0_g1~~TRINITY_DN107586_c0_g1_i1.p1  ORF type:complete len:786 (-),score=116.96 TRINITY_DN107586_c0_g1_i1:21-2378(-)
MACAEEFEVGPSAELSHSYVMIMDTLPKLEASAGDRWLACKPPGFVAWTYRDHPGRNTRSPKKVARDQELRLHKLRSSTVTPSTRAPSCLTSGSPDLRSPTPLESQGSEVVHIPAVTRRPSSKAEKRQSPRPSKSTKSKVQSASTALDDSLPQDMASTIKPEFDSIAFSDQAPKFHQLLESSQGNHQEHRQHRADRLESASLIMSTYDYQGYPLQSADRASEPASPLSRTQATKETSLSSLPRERVEVLEGLQAAADAMGARARGAVSTAIRAKAVCRSTFSSVSRRLLMPGHPRKDLEALHALHARSPTPDAEEVNHDPRNAIHGWIHESKPFTMADLQNDAVPEESQLESPNENFLSVMSQGSHEEVDKRRIEVPISTTLGKMAAQDPDRAAKYGIVVMPAWTVNKPWPPPPVKANFQSAPSPFALERTEAAKAILQTSVGGKGEIGHLSATPRAGEKIADRRSSPTAAPAERAPSKPASPSKTGSPTPTRWSRVRPIARLRGVLKDITRKRTGSPVIATRPKPHAHVNKEEAALRDPDVEPEMKAWYRHCFDVMIQRLNYPPGQLRPEGMLRCLAEVGIYPKTQGERTRLKDVQERVIHAFRHSEDEQDGSEASKVKNPITERKGAWLFPEFLAMVTQYNQLQDRDQHAKDAELARQNGCEDEQVRNLRKVYADFAREDEDDGVLTLKEFIAILQTVGISENPTNEELAELLQLDYKKGSGREIPRKTPIEIAQFVRAMLKVEAVLSANDVREGGIEAIEEKQHEHGTESESQDEDQDEDED